MVWSNSEPPCPTHVIHTREIPLTWVGIIPAEAGLVNINNSCFLNSSLQALMHLPAFADFLKRDEAHRTNCYSLLNCMVCAVYRTYLNMSIHRTFKPTGLFNLLPRLNKNFKLGQQEDAHEFMIEFLGKIEDELLRRYTAKPEKLDLCTKQTTFIGQLFTWWMQTNDTCLDCKKAKITYVPISLITVQATSGSLQQAVSDYVQFEETITDFSCTKKCTNRKCSRTLEFFTYPKVLKIVVNRFDEFGNKISLPVNIDRKLVVGRATYTFSSCIVHEGPRVKSGHYTCVAQTADGMTMNYNDAVVTSCSLQYSSFKTDIYIAFYQLHHFKTLSIKREPPTTPSKALSPVRKKLHVSPVKKSMEKKRGKILNFSPRKLKRKFGEFFQSIILPSKAKKVEKKIEAEILAEPLLIDSSEEVVQVIPPLQRKRSLVLTPEVTRPRSQGLSESTITGIETPIKGHLRTHQRHLSPSSSATATAIVTPVKISLMKSLQEHSHRETSSPASSTTATAIVTPVKISAPWSAENQSHQECYSPCASDTVTAFVTPIKVPTKIFCGGPLSSCTSNVTNDAKVTPLKIFRQRRSTPKISDSQSSHEYILKAKEADVLSERKEILCDENTLESDPQEENFFGYEEDNWFGDEVENIFADEIRTSPLSSDRNNGADEEPNDVSTKTFWSPQKHREEFDEYSSSDDNISEEGKLLEDDIFIIDENIEEENMAIILPPLVHNQNTCDIVAPCELLPNPILEKNTVKQMKAWLKSKDIAVGGTKAQLMEKIKFQLAGHSVRNDDMQDKEENFIPLTQEISRLTDEEIFPVNGWGIFPSRDIPSSFNFGSVFYYLVETMPQLELTETPTSHNNGESDPVSSDEEDTVQITISDPFEDAECKEIRCSKKLRRGLQYVKSGYVRNVHDSLPNRVHLYRGQVRASMNPRAYLVKVAVSQISGTIMKCVCDIKCPARALGRCTHISALLLYVLLHKNLNGPEAITCTSRPVTWNTGSLKRNPSAANERQYDSFKIDVKRRSTFDPRPTAYQTGYPTPNQINDFLYALGYKKKPSLFQSLLKLGYEDFDFDAEEKEILKILRGQLYTSLTQQLIDLKPSAQYVGAFEVPGTTDQSETEMWKRIRSLHCSAQPSRRVAHFQTISGRKRFLQEHLWGIKDFKSPQTSYGKEHEDEARDAYAEIMLKKDPSAVVEKCGLYLHTDHVGFSCSPDGIKTSSLDPFPKKLLEIKVIYSYKDSDITQFESIMPKEKLKDFCLKRNTDGKLVLKDNHQYYDQVQFSMGLLNIPECDLFLWTEKSSLTVPVPFDNDRWLSLRESLRSFHWQYLVPEYFAQKTPRNLPPVCLD